MRGLDRGVEKQIRALRARMTVGVERCALG
jgi:hypothetical protein